MPRRTIEIKSFLQGVSSIASSTDASGESARFSLNIDPAMAQGRLQGIDGDKILSDLGFQDEDRTYEHVVDYVEIAFDSTELATISDFKELGKVHAVSISTNSVGGVNNIKLYTDIYSDSVNPGRELTPIGGIASIPDKHNMQTHDDKVFIGLGGDSTTPTQVAMKLSEGGFANNDTSLIGLFDTKLYPPIEEKFGGVYTHFMTFPIHGDAPTNSEGLGRDDSGTITIRADWDKEVDIDTDYTMWYHLTNASGLLYGFEVGQIFRCSTTDDTSDFCLRTWKRFDYDKESTVTIGDLFMFCGYATDEQFPVFRFVGNSQDDSEGGTPAFTYALKDDSTKIYKISNTTNKDADAFDATHVAGNTIIGNAGASGSTYTVLNTGLRVTELDLAEMDATSLGPITSIAACHSPMAYNGIGLKGGSTPYSSISSSGDTHEASSLYYNNGHARTIYRYGVFYIGEYDSPHKLYRANLIDFHQQTTSGIKIEALDLNFDKIPSQLHAENKAGIVQRTLEDIMQPDESLQTVDSKYKAQFWSNQPQQAYIVGICETFENGSIKEVSDETSSWSDHKAWKITTKQKSRLTTGDTVRFAGMAVTDTVLNDDEVKSFNTGDPYEVNVISDGDGFYIDVQSDLKKPVINSSWNSQWWNAKVWVLYAKRNPDSTFDDWDLFLYCANTIDVDSSKRLHMADRTPPFHQVRKLPTLKKNGNIFSSPNAPGDDDDDVLYYPAEFVFIKKGTLHPDSITTDKIAKHGTSIGNPDNTDNYNVSSVFDSVYSEFGIYDKSGHWSINGGKTSLHRHPTAHLGEGHENSGTDAHWHYNWQGMQGGLYFGSNLGWDADDTRRCQPLTHSLHPLVPYSSLYMGNLVYPGYNIDTANMDEDALNLDEFYVNDANTTNGQAVTKINKTYNRPKHAVTFLSKVSGKFIEKPGLIWRASTWQTAMFYLNQGYGLPGESQDYVPYTWTLLRGGNDNPPDSGGYYWHYLGYNNITAQANPKGQTLHPFWLAELRMKDANASNVITYNKDTVLFTIDDFSGHRGSLEDKEDSDYDLLDIDSDGYPNWPTKSHYEASGDSQIKYNNEIPMPGIDIGRPNWGGPEIENPRFKADGAYDKISADDFIDQMSPPKTTRSSVNGGNYDVADDSNDKGWDGYAPPTLFNPGAGYYVYINRSWRSEQIWSKRQDTAQGESDSVVFEEYDEDDNTTNTYGNFWIANFGDPDDVATWMWGFQIRGGAGAHMKYLAHEKAWDSNRWHNFSSTCIGDNVHDMYLRYNAEWDNGISNSVINSEWDECAAQTNYIGEEAQSTVDHTPVQSRFIWRMPEKQVEDTTQINNGGDYGDIRSQSTFGGVPNLAPAVCTMQKIDIPDLGQIYNIFPCIVKSDISHTASANSNFISGYLMGARTAHPQNDRRSIFLNTNLDYIYSTILSGNAHQTVTDDEEQRLYESPMHNHPLASRQYQYHTKLRQSTAAWNYDPNDNFPEGHDMRAPLQARGTAPLEVITLTSENPTRFELNSSGGAEGNSGTDVLLKQIVVDSNDHPLAGEKHRIYVDEPWAQATTNGTSQDWYVQSVSTDGASVYFGADADRGYYDSENEHNYNDLLVKNGGGGTAGFATTTWLSISDDIADNHILQSTDNFVAITPGTEGTGALTAGKYFYKFAYEYDNQFESPLHDGAPQVTELTAGSDATSGLWDHIKLEFSIPETAIFNLPKRVTGISIYRKKDGGVSDAYNLVAVMKLNEGGGWTKNGGDYNKTILDDGNLLYDYETGNGISPYIKDTSLNYGLSTRLHGYLFVSDAWNEELPDSKHYIFRSLPNNFFAFDWSNHWLAMPEQPIAMTTFQSKLYAWGKKKLYKIDPMNLVIEDEYEGVSIASRFSYATTEYGLCFLDENNIYLHNGNKPIPIGNPILYATNESIVYNTTTSKYDRLKQGYREIIKNTVNSNYNPRIVYSGLKNSFVVILYSEDIWGSGEHGVGFSYNIDLERWDIWKAPTPKGVTTANNGDILISDGVKLYQYLSNESKNDYSEYHQQEWDWFSQDINFGVDVQDKVFKTLSMTGTPCVYDWATSTPADYSDASNTKTLSVQALVDNEPVALSVKNKFYDTIRLGNAIISESITFAGWSGHETELQVKADIGNSESSYDRFEFFRPGHLIKVDDEIMLVESVVYNTGGSPEYNSYININVKRGMMGTSTVIHDADRPVYFVSPKFSFPGGTKGKRLRIELHKQRGYVDSLSITYKPKAIK